MMEFGNAIANYKKRKMTEVKRKMKRHEKKSEEL